MALNTSPKQQTVNMLASYRLAVGDTAGTRSNDLLDLYKGSCFECGRVGSNERSRCRYRVFVFRRNKQDLFCPEGSSHKLYISRRTSPWKLQPATILTNTNSMNFSQHSSYGERNVPLHGPSPRAQANGVSRTWRPADLPQSPLLVSKGLLRQTPKRECPPATPSPVPKFADAHTAAEAYLRHHRHEPRRSSSAPIAASS